MLKIILSGSNGRMGRVIANAVKNKDDCTIVAGIDPNTEVCDGFHVFSSPADCGEITADVIVDFSHPGALAPLLDYAVSRKLPIVAATTGLSPEQTRKLREASRSIPVFHSANMSLGVNLMLELCKLATRVLGGDFDIEIIEKHHNQKIDAPSGTALMLADSINGELPEPARYVYDRQSVREKRDKRDIGIVAVRGGTIAGEHDVLFAGRDELLTISHSARSRDIFAIGAINAALFLSRQDAGLYSMSDLINQEQGV